MKRYSIHQADGTLVAEVDTLQQVGDKVQPGQWSYDWITPPEVFSRYTAWRREDGTGYLVGTPCHTEEAARLHCR